MSTCYIYQQNGADLVMIAEVENSGYSSRIRPDTMAASSKISVSENEIYYIKVPKYSYHAAPYHLVTAFILK